MNEEQSYELIHHHIEQIGKKAKHNAEMEYHHGYSVALMELLEHFKAHRIETTRKTIDVDPIVDMLFEKLEASQADIKALNDKKTGRDKVTHILDKKYWRNVK